MKPLIACFGGTEFSFGELLEVPLLAMGAVTFSDEARRTNVPLFQRIGALDDPHETSLVTVLLDRIKIVESPLRDPEAERMIRQTTAEQLDAAYYLVQTVLIQDLSLHIAQNRIAELEKDLAETTTLPSAPPSFLGGRLTVDEPALKTAAPT